MSAMAISLPFNQLIAMSMRVLVMNWPAESWKIRFMRRSNWATDTPARRASDSMRKGVG